MTYWHRAARLLRGRLREAEGDESGLSTEVLQLGAKARHLEVLAQDQREHIKDIEAKLVRALSEADQLRAALVQAAQTVWEVGQSMRAAIPADCSELLGRDMVGHINIMAGHGDPDYLNKSGNSIRHVDLREKPPRKKKANAN